MTTNVSSSIVQRRYGYLCVPYLYEDGDKVVVFWLWLGGRFFLSCDPALRFGK